MNVYINGRFLTQSVTGVQRYAHELVKALDAMIGRGEIDPQRFRLVLLAPRDLLVEPEYRFIALRKIGIFSGHYWEQLELPFYARDGILLSLTNAAPVLKRRQIVTIHDAAVFAFPNVYSFFFRQWYRILIRLLGKTAQSIVTVSNFSKNELSTYCGIASDKIRVFYEGKEHLTSAVSDPKILVSHQLTRNGYVLASASMNPNKNIKSVIEAVNLLGDNCLKIVVAGGANPKVFNFRQTLQLDNVVDVGYVNDGELKALYENALCLVYPSFYEGFGLPPLEAHACGCPVVVSSAASLPEVCRGAALYCNPYNPADIADIIRVLMSNATLREELKELGLAQGERFTWRRCATELFDMVRNS
jgi:glycosyltransferase involved in cell wall biosynthesis